MLLGFVELVIVLCIGLRLMRNWLRSFILLTCCWTGRMLSDLRFGLAGLDGRRDERSPWEQEHNTIAFTSTIDLSSFGRILVKFLRFNPACLVTRST